MSSMTPKTVMFNMEVGGAAKDQEGEGGRKDDSREALWEDGPCK